MLLMYYNRARVICTLYTNISIIWITNTRVISLVLLALHFPFYPQSFLRCLKFEPNLSFNRDNSYFVSNAHFLDFGSSHFSLKSFSKISLLIKCLRTLLTLEQRLLCHNGEKVKESLWTGLI